MKNFIYNEMMVHVPVCTSKAPENVLIISDDTSALEIEMQKHTGIAFKSVQCGLDAIREEADASYDVVICESGEDAAVMAHISRVLKEDGLVTMTHPSLDKTTENKSMMHILGKYFKVIMPYNLGNGSTALLSSKEYHPTADINLHRADMLDGLEYYNCDIHPASFAMGNNVRKEYLGIIKN
ncbi:MAG: spermidine synthase [Sulfurimonas sp.]|jgi:spermidine synthase|uniref:spermidine synthase n=1 Tax=Sulfurimonas sp. TaxID=2022749 RepID=UPI0039E3D159